VLTLRYVHIDSC